MKREKVAIVTGGARSIGKSIAKKLFADGYRVMICSRNVDEIKETVYEVDPQGEDCQGITADVSRADHCTNLVEETMNTFGRIDVLVNNAGIYGPIGLLEENDSKEWEQTFGINVFGMMFCTKAVLPVMKKQKSGVIINLAGAGVGGKRPLPRFSAYYTTKTTVVAFTEVIAAETAEDNIRVNCISPGAVNSFFTDYLLTQGKEKAGEAMYNQALKQKENGGDSPELSAEMISFLVSDKATHISGKMISAKWEKMDELVQLKPFPENLYNLRRIDNTFFYEKES